MGFSKEYYNYSRKSCRVCYFCLYLREIGLTGDICLPLPAYFGDFNLDYLKIRKFQNGSPRIPVIIEAPYIVKDSDARLGVSIRVERYNPSSSNSFTQQVSFFSQLYDDSIRLPEGTMGIHHQNLIHEPHSNLGITKRVMEYPNTHGVVMLSLQNLF
ncbi:MAG: hypothetical protein MUF68_09280, partial [Cyclobacteriaceae bacterium]|nr:hypothetical protein [Cyclobacteriaceae bacterium]